MVTRPISTGLRRLHTTTNLVGKRSRGAAPMRSPGRRCGSRECRTCGLRLARLETTLQDLISGIEDGVPIEGRGSYSIDQQRYNLISSSAEMRSGRSKAARSGYDF